MRHEITPDHAWSGSRYIDVRNPQPGDISFWEIATGLSREQRYRGAVTSVFWSVAQHSLLCVRLAEDDGVDDDETLRTLLMHDATEYILGDVIRPVKRQLPEFQRLEACWWWAISESLGLPLVTPEIINYYDRLACAVEKNSLVSPRAGAWCGLPAAGDRTIPSDLLALTPGEAFAEFTRVARRLGIV